MSTYLQYQEVCSFLKTDLVALFNSKKFIGDINDNVIHGFIIGLGTLNKACYRSACANVCIPWTVTNAVAIMSLIDVYSQYFAVYPLSGSNTRQNILLDVTVKTNLVQNHFFIKGTLQNLTVYQMKYQDMIIH